MRSLSHGKKRMIRQKKCMSILTQPDDVGPDIAAELFPGTDPAKLSFAEMVDFLKLKRFGSLVDDEMEQQVFILDLSFNPEITDELMVIYFDLNKEIFCITHES